MAAPRGNQFWKARSSHGRKPIFANPESLRDAAEEYFDWNSKHPLLAAELIKFRGMAKLKKVPKMRAMTINALCIFLGISLEAWSDYRNRNDFIPVTREIEEIIRTQKFEGAAAEMLNPNIIARDLGLRDSTEITGKDGLALSMVVEFVKDEKPQGTISG